MEANNKKRVKRSSNFTKEEELLLVEEVEKLKNIIESKTTDKVNNQEKSQCWHKVTTQFNAKASSQQARSTEQLKSKYENMKTKARKYAADNISYLRGTGGGPSQKLDWDPAVEGILRVINEKTVVGFQVPNDSDATLFDDVYNHIENIEVINQDENEEDAVPSSSELDDSQLTKVEKKSTQTADIQICSSMDWSKYTPKQLRTPMNNKLRTKRLISICLQLAKEQYYKTKNILLLEDIQQRKVNEEDRLRKRQREEEEHEIKMRILECDFKLKEKELDMK